MDLLSNPEALIKANEEQDKLGKEIIELKNTAWEEKYRPTKLDDVILPDNIKNNVRNSYKDNEFQNMIFHSGSPGTGKTTVARVIPEEHGCDYMFIKAAGEARLELVEAISSYGMQQSVNGKPRFVVLDEGDRIPPNSINTFYAALQPLIESTADTLRYIITCNSLHLIPQAIHSRCRPISFSHADSSVKKSMWKRLKQIAELETKKSGGTVNKETLGQIAKVNYPDMRAMINHMQFNFKANNGSIDGNITTISLDHIKKVWELIKENDEILPVRKYYTEHISDLNEMYLPLLNHITDNDYEFSKKYILSLGKIVSDHMFMSAFDRMEPEVNVFGMVSKIIRLIHHG